MPTTVSPRHVRELRRVYEIILRSKISDQAPLDQQHAWWRLHDAAKHEYAVADWKWESLVLRFFIIAAAVAVIISFFDRDTMPFAVGWAVAALWRCYVVLTRHAPE